MATFFAHSLAQIASLLRLCKRSVHRQQATKMCLNSVFTIEIIWKKIVTKIQSRSCKQSKKRFSKRCSSKHSRLIIQVKSYVVSPPFPSHPPQLPQLGGGYAKVDQGWSIIYKNWAKIDSSYAKFPTYAKNRPILDGWSVHVWFKLRFPKNPVKNLRIPTRQRQIKIISRINKKERF